MQVQGGPRADRYTWSYKRPRNIAVFEWINDTFETSPGGGDRSLGGAVSTTSSFSVGEKDNYCGGAISGLGRLAGGLKLTIDAPGAGGASKWIGGDGVVADDCLSAENAMDALWKYRADHERSITFAIPHAAMSFVRMYKNATFESHWFCDKQRLLHHQREEIGSKL